MKLNRRLLITAAAVLVLSLGSAAAFAAQTNNPTNKAIAGTAISTKRVQTHRPVADSIQKSDSTIATDTATPSPTPTSAAPSKSTASKPVTSTSVSNQSSPVNVPVTYVQPQYDTVVESATLSLGSSACQYAGKLMYGYSYSVSFNGSNKGGTLSVSFEYDQASQAVPGLVTPPYFTPVKFSPATVRVSDTIYIWNGLTAYQQTAYRIRMHVDSLTPAYSNWIDIPADTTHCP